MNKNKLYAIALVALSSISGWAASQQDIADAASVGGIVVKPAKGYVGLIDYQKRLNKDDILALSLPNNGFFKLDFRHRVGEGAFSIAKAAETKGDANVAIFIVDDPTLPMTLTALEARWGVINIAALSQDKPKILKLLPRVDKLMTRLGTMLLGGVHSLDVPFSAMKPIHTVADLDALTGNAFSAPALTQINFTLPKLGLAPSFEATYEQACLQGWAPEPKTEIQKQIWEEVHAAPTNPIKIKPESQRKK